MNHGAYHVHQHLKDALIAYLKTQYLGHSDVLLEACDKQMEQPGNLWSQPYIESSPAYESIPDGIAHADIDEALKGFFGELIQAELGVYQTPFRHQIEALEAAMKGQDLFVSTGTGSGKTECFMWPLIARLACEAANSPGWNERGVRVVVMYPMNALVADQVGRLRRLIGDQEGKFLQAFRHFSGSHARRPQFGMYTGRTPYAGNEPDLQQDKALAASLEHLLPASDSDPYYAQLLRSGRIPAKADLRAFIEKIRAGQHETSAEDAELITRFEIQKTCPDILITNYSMLEYMLLRQCEDAIWDQTKTHFAKHPEEKLLFIIDEAHMYRGSSGGEVSLLIRRLMSRLDLPRERLQFILTTASMPHSTPEDDAAVQQFAGNLTSSLHSERFIYLYGHHAKPKEMACKPISAAMLAAVNLEKLDSTEAECLAEVNRFIASIAPQTPVCKNLEEASHWLNAHLSEYQPFQLLLQACRGKAVSLDALAQQIFPKQADAMRAMDTMLTLAPLAHDAAGNVLFPARMHMLFRGFSGINACANPQCPHSHEGNGVRLGEVFLNDQHAVCPVCKSRVYQLYTDRRCGALFFHGYVYATVGKQYLWTQLGAFDKLEEMKELHLYLPIAGDTLPAGQKRGRAAQYRCWLDIHSGYLTFDDSDASRPGFRELWYSVPAKPRKDKPWLLTFGTCPKCRAKFANTAISGFSTRGNEPFYNVIQAQFQEEPPASAAKEADPQLPNDGRKVLLFSDSRQKAARLARDMSISSDNWAVRKLFMVALEHLEEAAVDEDVLLNDIYSYIVQEAARQNLDLFSNDSRTIFRQAQSFYRTTPSLSIARRRAPKVRKIPLSDAPQEMQEHILRLFCMPYNTLMDNGLCYLEPEYDSMILAMDILAGKGVQIDEDKFIEAFSAISRKLLTDHMALSHQVPEEWRENVGTKYGNEDYGVSEIDALPETLQKLLGCESSPEMQRAWMDAMKEFMTAGVGNSRRFFFNPSRLVVCNGPEHVWYRCGRCAKIAPFLLNGLCQNCGSEQVQPITDFAPEAFWRTGILQAVQGKPIRVIDTEEHTAQLGHKDQRNNVWAQTEQYEMRFQDMIRGGEKPIDVLSSTTTMEVGIDIGSLVAVGLRNMPPMRENYQQRAGRAGRRGASLSTIVTFAEGGPHDAYYFKHPEPMFRGDPRRPWIDVRSPKLMARHLHLILINEVVRKLGADLSSMSVVGFLAEAPKNVQAALAQVSLAEEQHSFGDQFDNVFASCRASLMDGITTLRQKVDAHPEVYGVDQPSQKQKSLLDALYEEGLIPTYSFPKDVVSVYIENEKGDIQQQVERGLDVAISEYAPGRSIVVDKKTYIIGGLYCHTEGRYSFRQTASYLNDANYVKHIKRCKDCGWFGYSEDVIDSSCPLCHSLSMEDLPDMVRPWGFSPLNNREQASNVQESYSSAGIPQYSTIPDESAMEAVNGWQAIRKAVRCDQQIILMNPGMSDKGFMICEDCGAAVPGNDPMALKGLKRPGNKVLTACNHQHTRNICLGYSFMTDMLVLTLELPRDIVESREYDARIWRERAATTLAEAMRKAATILLDIEYDEIQAGFRIRESANAIFVDTYLYDSLSSGAGYCSQIGERTEELLERTQSILTDCTCEHACQSCLKHYRNQRIQSQLDRFAALELLSFGHTMELPPLVEKQDTVEMLMSLQTLLADAGITIEQTANDVILSCEGKRRRCIVYPVMMKRCKQWEQSDCLAVAKEALKDAKPHAMKVIVESFEH